MLDKLLNIKVPYLFLLFYLQNAILQIDSENVGLTQMFCGTE